MEMISLLVNLMASAVAGSGLVSQICYDSNSGLEACMWPARRDAIPHLIMVASISDSQCRRIWHLTLVPVTRKLLCRFGIVFEFHEELESMMSCGIRTNIQ